MILLYLLCRYKYWCNSWSDLKYYCTDSDHSFGIDIIVVLQPQNEENSKCRCQITNWYVLVFFDLCMHAELSVQLYLLPPGSPRYTAVPRRHRIISNRRKASLTVKEADWEIPFSCVTFQGEIDSGAFGLIYRGVIDCSHQPDCVEIAIKVLKSRFFIRAHLAFMA